MLGSKGITDRGTIQENGHLEFVFSFNWSSHDHWGSTSLWSGRGYSGDRYMYTCQLCTFAAENIKDIEGWTSKDHPKQCRCRQYHAQEKTRR